MSDFELEVEDAEEGDGHSLLSPSGAPRYLRCLASVYLSKDYPNKETEDSKEGTRAHALAEKALSMNAEKVCASPSEGISEEMAEAVNRYMADVRRISEGAIVRRYEERLDLADVMQVPGEAGTADCLALVGRILQVHDLKYGKGVVVSAEGNEQLMIYALGGLEYVELIADEVEAVHLYIHQPRLKSVTEYRMTVAELLKWRDEVLLPKVGRIMEIMQTGQYIDADIVPGDKQCRFCLHRPDCQANRKLVLSTLASDFDDFDQAVVTDPVAVEKALHAQIDSAQFIQPKQIANELPYYDLMIKVIKARKERALELAMQGLTIPGFKVVAGREGNRKWKDEEIAAEVLKGMRLTEDERFKQVVISPTEAEKIFTKGEKKSIRRWNRLQHFITRSEAKPTLVPLSDKREPLAIGCKADDFTEMLPEPKTLEPHPDAEEPMDNSIFL